MTAEWYRCVYCGQFHSKGMRCVYEEIKKTMTAQDPEQTVCPRCGVLYPTEGVPHCSCPPLDEEIDKLTKDGPLSFGTSRAAQRRAAIVQQYIDFEQNKAQMDHFSTGTKRERVEARYDLIPPECIRRVALIYAEGVPKYGDKAWLNGLPYSVVYNHLMEHFTRWLEGDRTEDHLAKIAWGVFVLMYYEHREQYAKDLDWSTDGIDSKKE